MFIKKLSKYNKIISIIWFWFSILFIIYILSNMLNCNKLPVEESDHSNWGIHVSRWASSYIYPEQNTTILHPQDVCEHVNLFLLIVVFSAPSNFKPRQAIRDTYGNTNNFNYSAFNKIHTKYFGNDLKGVEIDTNISNANSIPIRIIFLLGTTNNDTIQIKVINESNKNHDIIQENFIDSYNNLTIKTLMMLKWGTINCPDKVKFIMKADDDTFVNVPNLVHILLGRSLPSYTMYFKNITFNPYNIKESNKSETVDFIYGYKFTNTRPIRDSTSKFYTPYYLYEGRFFPDYVSGTAYVLSINVFKRLYSVGLFTPILPLEDVFITGICANLAQVQSFHSGYFSYMTYFNRNLGCMEKNMITHTEINPKQFKKIYYNVLLNNKLICLPL